jgi:hypothetical protein
VDVVRLEEKPVATAAIHGFLRELAEKFASGLRENARKPNDSVESLALPREVGR